MNDEPMEMGEPLPEDEARALRVMTLELRDAEAPELDWDGIEARLMAKIASDGEEAEVVSLAEAQASRWPQRLGLLAVAAGVLLVLWNFARPQDPAAPKAPVAVQQGEEAPAPVEPPPAAAPAALDLKALPKVDALGGPAMAVSALKPGTEIVADDEPLRFGIAGVVAWTLAPGSVAVVDTTSVPHSIRLQRGHVDAEVNPDRPGQPLEAFAVVAGATRVAVRGTVFSVTRKADRVSVSVSRGKVAVGSTDDGAEAHLLVSPGSADFALTSGKRLAQAEVPSLPAPSPSTAVVDEPMPATPPAPEHVLLTVGEARAKMLGCLQGALGRAEAGEAKITVRSQVTVITSESGDVTAVRFNPPLRPDLQQTCGGMLFGQRLQPAGQASFSIQLSNR